MCVSRDDIVVVLVCGTSWMTSPWSRLFTPRRVCFGSNLCPFLDHRNQQPARKHRVVVLPHCRKVRSTLYVATRVSDSSRREHDWPPQDSTPSPAKTSSHDRPGSHTLQIPALLLPGCAAVPACCTPFGEKPVCHDWSQRQTLFAASQDSDSPEFQSGTSTLHTILTDVLLPNAELTSPARRRSLFHILFDLLVTIFMLACCTRPLGACLRLLIHRRLWWFQLFHPPFLCRTCVPVVGGAIDA